MRNYTQTWNYSLTYSSLPYAINNGSPSFVSGWYRAYTNTFINRGSYGGWAFFADNYSGNYALKFTLRTDNAGVGSRVMSLRYGTAALVPAIEKTSIGVRLGWSYYGGYLNYIGGDPDWSGYNINEPGNYTVIFLKRRIASGYSETSACIISPSGVKHSSRWYNASDSAGRNQLGVSNSGYYGFFEFGSLDVADQLTDAEADSIRLTGNLNSYPIPTIVPASGTLDNSPVHVVINPPSNLPSGWDLRYTVDGTTPINGVPEMPSTFGFLSTPILLSNEPLFSDVNDSLNSLVEFNSTVYTVGDSSVRSLDMTTGITTTVISGEYITSLVTDGTNLYGANGNTGVGGLYLLDVQAGTVQSVITTPSVIYDDICVLNGVFYGVASKDISGNPFYYTGAAMPVVYVIDVVAGTETPISQWYFAFSSIVVHNGVLYASSNGENVYTVSELGGDPQQLTSNSQSWKKLVSHNGVLYGFISGGGIYSIDTATGEITSVNDTARLYRTALSHGDSIYASYDTVYDTREAEVYKVAGMSDVIPEVPGSPIYTAPFDIGGVFTPGTSAVVKAAYFNDADSTQGSVQTATYNFAMNAPLSALNNTQQTSDVAITWTNASTNPDIQIWYTLDGSDPQTSITALMWAPGSIYPFNSHPSSGSPSTYQWNYIKARCRYMPTNAWSSLTTVSIIFVLGTTTVAPDSGSYSGPVALTLASVNTTTAQVSINNNIAVHVVPSTLAIPFSQEPVNVDIVFSTLDGSLRTNTISRVYEFHVGAPVLSIDNQVSGIPVQVSATATTPGASIYYTLDGSSPTIASSSYTTPVTVNPNQTMLAISYLSGVYSTTTQANVFAEYGVTSVATYSNSDGNYHYYVANQRLELTSQLGIGQETTTLSNTTPSTVSASIDNVPVALSVWDTGGSVEYNLRPVNAFSHLKLLSGALHTCWTRYAFRQGSAQFTLDISDVDFATWLTTNTQEKFRVKACSRYAEVHFRFSYDSGVVVSAWLVPVVGTATLIGTVNTGAPSSSLVWTVFVSSSAVSLSSGASVLTVTTSGQDTNPTWHLETVMNPLKATATTFDVPCVITTTATTAFLRRAPGSIYCTRSNITLSKTVALDFAAPENAELVNTGYMQKQWGTYTYYVRPCDVGHSIEHNALVCGDPLFDIKFPSLLSISSADFSTTVDFDYYMQPDMYRDSNASDDVAFCLMSAGSSLGTSDLGSFYVKLSSRREASNNSVLYVETQNSSTVIRTHYAMRRIKFTITKTGTTLNAFAIIDGAVVALGGYTIGSGFPSVVEVHLKKNVVTDQSNSPVPLIIRNYTCTGLHQEVVCSNPVLVGADFKHRGLATGFGSVALTIPDNSIRAVWFNAETKEIELNALGFEPTDGRLLIGILESTNGVVYWTNTMYANLVHVSYETSGAVTGGALLGVGTDITIHNGHVSWVESGKKRSKKINDSTWTRPLSTVDLRTNTLRLRAYNKQAINVTVSTRPTV